MYPIVVSKVSPMVFRLICLFLFTTGLTYGQTSVGLVAHYTFDGTLEDRTGNTSNTGIAVGTPTFVCGIDGQAILLDGANDQVRIPNTASIAEEFDREDFTISFYFKTVGFNGVQYLISKRDTACSNPRQFFVRYVPNSQTINTFLAQDADKDLSLLNVINNFSCWQHFVIVRDDTRVSVYLNGKFLSDLGTASRIDLDTEGPLYIGGADCIGGIETPFGGLMDELRIYNRALGADEIAGLYLRPDQILTNDTIIFQGNTMEINLSTTCGTDFNWTPTDNVNSPTDAEPLIDAVDPGVYTYYVQVSDQVSSCVATDSIKITVVDPNTLPCKVAMAKAFTPNNDQLNDSYGLSNPFAITDMVSLEIFDRWGGRVFVTSDPFLKWDATFEGEPVKPGVFLWRAIYRCSGEEVTDTGTVTVIR
jgi:gliding motility-associated-like protein